MKAVSMDLVQVWSTTSILEGEIARARLEAEGIPVLVKSGGEGPYRMGPVYLWVPVEVEVQARLILDSQPEPISDEELAALAEGAADEDRPEEPGQEP